LKNKNPRSLLPGKIIPEFSGDCHHTFPIQMHAFVCAGLTLRSSRSHRAPCI